MYVDVVAETNGNRTVSQYTQEYLKGKREMYINFCKDI